jgi:hypothetical protein
MVQKYKVHLSSAFNVALLNTCKVHLLEVQVVLVKLYLPV